MNQQILLTGNDGIFQANQFQNGGLLFYLFLKYELKLFVSLELERPKP